MNHNVGTADRAARITLGIVLLLAAVVVQHEARWFGLIGLIPLLTGVVGSCPLYSLFGISTCALPKAEM
jgi:hypothetical protein